MEATVKEKFDQLYRQLENNFSTFFDSYSKFSGSYILIMGWLITSDGARKFLSGEGRPITFIAMGIILSLSALYSFLCLRMYRKSNHLRAMLGGLDYMEPDYFKSRAISSVSFNIILIGNIVITLALCVILFYVSVNTVTPPPAASVFLK